MERSDDDANARISNHVQHTKAIVTKKKCRWQHVINHNLQYRDQEEEEDHFDPRVLNHFSFVNFSQNNICKICACLRNSLPLLLSSRSGFVKPNNGVNK